MNPASTASDSASSLEPCTVHQPRYYSNSPTSSYSLLLGLHGLVNELFHYHHTTPEDYYSNSQRFSFLTGIKSSKFFKKYFCFFFFSFKLFFLLKHLDLKIRLVGNGAFSASPPPALHAVVNQKLL